MNSSDRLEQLKKQVKDTSNKQRQLQAQKESAQEVVSKKKRELQENQKEITELIRSVFGQSELAAAKEREFIENILERFSHLQSVMNEQLITLNDNLTDTTSLQDLYTLKKNQLDSDYQEQINEYKDQIYKLQDNIAKYQNTESDLESEISKAEERLKEITEKMKKASFWFEFKKNWLNKWFNFALVGFCAVFLGGIFGWTIYEVIDSLFAWIRGLFG